ncbi:MAG: type III pantothenate kinase [Cyclobacteriaceae bacterium]
MENKKNIVVDIGNSRIKSGLFEGDELLETSTWEDLMGLKSYCENIHPHKIGFISVGGLESEILNLFEKLSPSIISRQSELPISIDYDTPQTLGIDRLVGAVGANDRYPEKNVLIIDMGSCITYDLVTPNATFQGGIISPGLQMRMKSMSDYTEKLPDIRKDWQPQKGILPGKSTKACMTIGSYDAIIHELNGFIEGFRLQYSGLIVILTGGDAPSFESKLKQPIFADSFLVLRGLNRILNQE